MKKYIVRIHTEEMKGRLDEVREIECSNYADAEEIFENYIDDLLNDEEVEDYLNTYDDKWVVEYFPKMRETIEIVEA